MNEKEVRKAIADLPVGGMRFFARTGSTNDEAKTWAAGGASDFSLVVAEQQARGRGRGDRHWLTTPESSLAFSLVLRPKSEEESVLHLFSALGALGVCEAVEALRLQPEIKWPNDVLLNGRKFCGVLAEAAWIEGKAEHVVLGIGVNVSSGSVPPSRELNFPAACVEEEAGRSIDRYSLLHEILMAVLYWRPFLSNNLFLAAWERRLAFRDQLVSVRGEAGEEQQGRLDGLERDGSLRLRCLDGTFFTVHFGEVHLRPQV